MALKFDLTEHWYCTEGEKLYVIFREPNATRRAMLKVAGEVATSSAVTREPLRSLRRGPIPFDPARDASCHRKGTSLTINGFSFACLDI